MNSEQDGGKTIWGDWDVVWNDKNGSEKSSLMDGKKSDSLFSETQSHNNENFLEECVSKNEKLYLTIAKSSHKRSGIITTSDETG